MNQDLEKFLQDVSDSPKLYEVPPPADEFFVIEMYRKNRLVGPARGEFLGYFIGCEEAGFGGVEGNACPGSLIEAIKSVCHEDALHNLSVVQSDGFLGFIIPKTRADYDATLVHET